MRYFGKSNIENTISTKAGATIKFEHVEAGRGIIASDDPSVVTELDARARERRGGVYELTAEQYAEELKKKSASPRPQQRQRSGIDSLMVPPLPSSPSLVAPAVAAEGAEASQPVETSKSVEPVAPSRPSVGRVRKMTKA